MNLSQQQISAGAESTGLFARMAVQASELRSQLRDAMGRACTVQGQATYSDGLAQQAALQDEANIRGNSGVQSFVEAGSSAMGEAVGFGLEYHATNSQAAQKTQLNLKRAETWETELKEMSSKKPAVLARLDGEPEPLNMAPAKKLTVDEMKQHIKNVRVTDERGNVVDYDDFAQNNQTAHNALEQVMTSSDDEMKEFAVNQLKEARDAVKKYRKENESAGNSGQHRSQTAKTLFNVVGTSWKAGLDVVNNKNLQMDEADQKLIESQARFLADANGAFTRQADNVAGNMTQHIQSIQQAAKEMYEANRA